MPRREKLRFLNIYQLATKSLVNISFIIKSETNKGRINVRDTYALKDVNKYLIVIKYRGRIIQINKRTTETRQSKTKRRKISHTCWFDMRYSIFMLWIQRNDVYIRGGGGKRGGAYCVVLRVQLKRMHARCIGKLTKNDEIPWKRTLWVVL